MHNHGARGPAKTFSERGMPGSLKTQADFQKMFNDCDDAIWSVDQAVGAIMQMLEDAGLNEEDVLVIVAADHGENFGEWGMYAGHGTADAATAHIPLIMSGPGFDGGQMIDGLCQHIDLASTLCQVVGAPQPQSWSAKNLPRAAGSGRPYVVTSQLAQCVQRSVHWLSDGQLKGYLRTAYPFGHTLPDECVYFPNDQPPVELDDQEDLDRGRDLLARFVTEHVGPHGDPWDERVASRSGIA